MHKQYRSVYASRIEQFIEMKRKLGFKFKTPAVILLHFDQLAEKTGAASNGITRELAEEWSKKRPNESNLYRYTRVQILGMFSTFLRDLGMASFVLKLPPYPESNFIPYIYSQKEIKAIFGAADRLQIGVRNMRSSIFSIPALLRLLYATGIRIGEALELREEDVNIDEKYLRVLDSKNGKQRIIPISASLASVLKQYHRQKRKLPLGKAKPSYFFVRLDGKRCGHQAVAKWFKDCLIEAGITCEKRNHFPRIHDLRHTFAVTSLATMAEAGIDLYASLPILSTYLGHGSLESTNHYVRLTANMYPDLLKDVDVICLDVFPKLRNYETH
jgi:integrase/recombinase XerD